MVEGGWGGWNPCFSRALNDWEVEEAERFLERLHGKRVLGDVDYIVVWTETKSGKFSTKSLYLALEADYPYLFPSSCIWNVWEQPNISFFAWEATWGKALTLDLVQKRRWVLANRYFMCLENEEHKPFATSLLKNKGPTGVTLYFVWGVLGYPLQLERLSLADKVLLWVKSTGRCGELLLFIYFGRFGRREIDWLLRMMSCQSRD
ncbi:hypothetical protein CK203_078186 [Vitis vinifera]|uniref:Reverse transcriptase zinc-binding domain-containing protein n=1 Tax=Vitis vinifera TaxID=29760 RepID=A0A438DUP0_VITVI|nr:hypothetical protein CK203_078186 [Vitis vinifera]